MPRQGAPTVASTSHWAGAAAPGGEAKDAEILGTDDVEELIALLRESPPLSPVIERLIYFIPADAVVPE